MGRVLRTPAGLLLVAFTLINIAFWIYTETAGSKLNAGTDVTAQQFAWTVVDAFLAWQVWRGRFWAWTVLLASTVLPLILSFIGGVFSTYAGGLVVFLVAQLVILLTPAVRNRASRGPQT
jgi:hypothetical protein